MPPRIPLQNRTTGWTPTLTFRSRPRHPISPQCPFRNLQTTTPIIDPERPIEPLGIPSHVSRPSHYKKPDPHLPYSLQPSRSKPPPAHSPQYNTKRAPPKPSKDQPRPPLTLTPSLREQLPLLASQPPFYATIHIHGKPYLITQGDTIRLPFLMHGVKPGDVLRLNRATSLGSRDFTLLGGARRNTSIHAPEEATAEPPTITTEPIVGRTDGLETTPYPASSTDAAGETVGLKKKGPPAYLDDRLFVCRATVMGTEAEPMRIKEKTKRRQRHVKMVRSKHKFTVVRVRELAVTPVSESVGEAEWVRGDEAQDTGVGREGEVVQQSASV